MPAAAARRALDPLGRRLRLARYFAGLNRCSDLSPAPELRTGTAGAFALLALIWGYNWVVMKIALRYSGPLEFAAWRCVLGALLLFAALAALRVPLAPRQVGKTIVLGLFQTTGFVGLVSWALTIGAAGKNAVLAYTMPFWVIAFGWPFLPDGCAARNGSPSRSRSRARARARAVESLRGLVEQLARACGRRIVGYQRRGLQADRGAQSQRAAGVDGMANALRIIPLPWRQLSCRSAASTGIRRRCSPRWPSTSSAAWRSHAALAIRLASAADDDQQPELVDRADRRRARGLGAARRTA